MAAATKGFRTFRFLRPAPYGTKYANNQVRSIFRSLLRIGRGWPDPLIKNYIVGTVRNRFRANNDLESKKEIVRALAQARRHKRKLIKARQGDSKELTKLVALATGEKGRLKHVLKKLEGKVKDLSCIHDYRSKKMINLKRWSRQPDLKQPVPVELLARFGSKYLDKDGFRKVPRVFRPIPQHGLALRKAKDGTFQQVNWWMLEDTTKVTTNFGMVFYRRRGKIQSHRISTEIKNRSRRHQKAILKARQAQQQAQQAQQQAQQQQPAKKS